MGSFPKHGVAIHTSFSKVSISNEDHNSSVDNPQLAEALHKSAHNMNKLDLQLLGQQSWVRSAGQTLHRLKGLYLTPENYELLFKSFNEEFEARKFAGEVLHSLSQNPLYLSGDALQTLEQNWTGNARSSLQSSSESSPVFAQIHISFYISARWEVVKEIWYLAVSYQLLDFLFGYAIISRELTSLGRTHVKTATSNIPVLCHQLQTRSVVNDFKSSVDGEIFSIQSDPIIGMLYCGNTWPEKNKQAEARKISEIIDQVYGMVRIGRRDITDPFLRMSSNKIQRPLSPKKYDSSSYFHYGYWVEDFSDMCMFMTNSFDGDVTTEEFTHSLAEAVRCRDIVNRIQLDGEEHAMESEQIASLIAMVEQKALPLKDINHHSRTCPTCRALDGLLV